MNGKKWIVTVHRIMTALKTVHVEIRCFIFAFNSHSEIYFHRTAFLQLFSTFSSKPSVNHKLHQSLLYFKFVLYKSVPIKSALSICQLYFNFKQSALSISPIHFIKIFLSIILYNSSAFLNFKWNCSREAADFHFLQNLLFSPTVLHRVLCM